MKAKLLKPFIAIFFLLLLSGAKAFGYQSALHDHENQFVTCEVCDKALIDQFSPLAFADTDVVFSKTSKEVQETPPQEYTTTLFKTMSVVALFSRPPPKLS